VEGTPAFWDYNIDDHDLFDGSWPDLHLTASSLNAIDKGTEALPDSLSALLDKFGVNDPHWGTEFDIGRYEAGFAIQPSPIMLYIDPGGVAHSTLGLYPIDLPFPVTLNVSSPSPRLVVTLEPTIITSTISATLTISDTQGGPPIPGLFFNIQISGDGSGFTNNTIVHLLIGGTQIYLPVTMRDINP
jgi:hypothetical protein